MLEEQSLRGFLDFVERQHPEHLLRIKEPVRRELDITSTVFELERAGCHPMVVFEQVLGASMPVVTNVAGSRMLLAAALGVSPRELPQVYRERCQSFTPVEVARETPWQEVVLEDDDLDLTKLPIPLHFAVDAAPYITAGQIAARDPETGADTTGFHRLMLSGRDRLGVSLHFCNGAACTISTAMQKPVARQGSGGNLDLLDANTTFFSIEGLPA